jgi:clan AA aspartic protease (TIGR02281 family)
MPKKNKAIIVILCTVLVVLSSQIAFADSFQDGVKAYNSGNYSYAENCFKNALQADQYNDVIKYYLAITLVRNKKIADAKFLYKNILETSSNQDVINLSRTGLKLLGEKSVSSNSKVTKAILNVNTMGNVLIVDNVNLNDAAKVKFIFDTGASYTTISSELARRLKIPTENAPKIKIMTGSDYIYAPKIKLKKIEINGLTAYNVEALVADLPMHNSGSADNIAGLLGLSFMKDFKITVDRPHNQIIIEK